MRGSEAENVAAAAPPVFRDGRYVRLWGAYTLSMFGSAITMTVLPVLAATTLRASPVQMGVLWTAAVLPWIVLGPFVGVFADRMPRRPILVAADLFRCAVLLLIPLAYVAGRMRIELLFLTSLGIAAGDVWFDIAQGSYIPVLVRNERLVAANSRLQISQSTASIAGPGIAGFLIQIAGAPFALLADAASYLLSAVLIASIEDVETPAGAAVRRARPSVLADMLDGFRFVWTHDLLRRLTLRLAAWHFVVGGLYSMVILYAVQTLGATPAQIGLLLSSAGAGLLAGSTAASWFSARIGVGPAIVACNVTAACGAALLPLASGSGAAALVPVGLALFAYGCCAVAYQINNASLRQALTPVPILGRMSATTRVLTLSLSGAGAVVNGFLAAAVGLREALALFAALGLVFALLGAFSKPVLALKTLPAAAPASG